MEFVHKIAFSLLMLFVSRSAIPQDAEKVFNQASRSVFTIETPSSFGTGFVVAPDIFVTCYHVVKGAGANLTLKQASGVTLDYITHNEDADIAVFRLSRKFQSHLTLGDSAAIGSPIYVIGSPLGALDRSITSGIISQRWNSSSGYELIQISAAISPGSSGSPVLNKSGQVVGMAQSSIEKGQSNNFALAIREIRKFIPKASGNVDNEKSATPKISANHLLTIRTHLSPIYSIAFSPDGSVLGSAGKDNQTEIDAGILETKKQEEVSTFGIWNTKTGRLKSRVQNNALYSDCVCFSNVSSLVAHSVAEKNPPINSLEDLADRKSSNYIEVWDWKTGELKFVLPAFKEEIKQIMFTKDGTRLISASRDGTVKVWNVQSQKLIWERLYDDFDLDILLNYQNGLSSFALSPNEEIFAMGFLNGKIFCYPLEPEGNFLDFVSSPSSEEFNFVQCVAFSPVARTLASCSGKNVYLWDIRLWDVKSRLFMLGENPKRSLKGHSSTVMQIVFSPNGKYVASASIDKTIRLWDVKTGKLKSTFYGHKANVWRLAFSPDGSKLASGDSDGTIMIWKMN
jgi:WD40 repeat protein